MPKNNDSLVTTCLNFLMKHHWMHHILFGVVLLFLSVSLLTYNPHDTSWFYYTTETLVCSNKAGVLGANVSALLFFLFGSAIFVILPLLFFSWYCSFYQKSLRKSELDRFLGFWLLFFCSSTLGSFYSCDLFYDIYPGGVLGSSIHGSLQKLFGVPIEGIFLHLIMIISLVLVTRLSLVKLVRRIFVTFRCYSSKEHLLRASTVVCSGFRTSMYPVKKLAHHIRDLFHATDIESSGQSIIEFETIVKNEFYQHSDDFWDIYFSKATAEKKSESSEHKENAHKEPEFTGGVKNKEVIPLHDTYHLPSLEFLGKPEGKIAEEKQLKTEQEQFAAILQEKLTRFGIQGSVSSIKSGPLITLIEYEPHIDSKISKIIALEDDLALALEAMSIRILAPIPGRSVVGFEIANKKRQSVMFSDIVSSSFFKQFSGHLPLALGKDTIGTSVVVDLVSMPHLLIAGSTGSGKSVALNTMLISMLYRCKPTDLRLLLIDPKRLEFASYADIPHLVFPIITDPQRAVLSLKWVVKTMEQRYEYMATCNVRNIFEYQSMAHQQKDLEPMPLIVVMIDELSDLMMTAGKEVEGYIARIAQMARAAGIHLIVATQRPSVDVITGLIKVNFPSRISFRVTSKADSRTILDASGAEKLLGKGDMLFMDSGSGLTRIHGGYVTHKEVEKMVSYIRSQQKPAYLDLYEEVPESTATVSPVDEALYQDVVAYIKTVDEVSISLLQRRFRIGYNRSARIIEQLETQGFIMPAEGSKTRKVIR